MGAGACVPARVDDTAQLDGMDSLVIYEALGLTSKQVGEFIALFWKPQKDCDFMTFNELLCAFEFNCVWLPRLLLLSVEHFAGNDGGMLMFTRLEVVVAVWNFCTAPPRVLAELLFNFLRSLGNCKRHVVPLQFNLVEVVDRMLIDYQSYPHDLTQLKDIVSQLAFENATIITLPQFVAAVTKESPVLLPLLQLQQRLQENLLTPTMWSLQSKRRVAFYGNKRIWEIVPSLFEYKHGVNVMVYVDQRESLFVVKSSSISKKQGDSSVTTMHVASSSESKMI